PDKETNATIKRVIVWTLHRISPNVIKSFCTTVELLESSATDERTSIYVAVLIQKVWLPMTDWILNAGMRISGALVEEKTYVNPEPRFSARYAIDDDNSIKLSYSRMMQYIHRVSSSAVSAPTDIWYPVTGAIRPQGSHQVSAAWQRLFP